MRKLMIFLAPVIFLSFQVNAQVGAGSIKGRLHTNDEFQAAFINVTIWKDGNLVTGGSTNDAGGYEIRQVDPGIYRVEFSGVGYQKLIIDGVEVSPNSSTYISEKQTVIKSMVNDLPPVNVVAFEKELFKRDPIDLAELTPKEIENLPVRNPADIIKTMPRVYAKDNGQQGVNINGMRTSANVMFLNGIKMNRFVSLPQVAIQNFALFTGGIPARYGDFTGGIVSITTKSASDQFHGSIDVLTSGTALGQDRYIGFDRFGYNLVEFSLTGPLLQIEKNGKKENLLGFFVAGNLVNELDPIPSSVGAWKVRDDVLARLKEEPLRPGYNDGSVLPNTDFLRLSDFEHVAVRPNVQQRSANLVGGIDVITNSKTNLSFGGSLNFQKGHRYDFDHSLMDFENYPLEMQRDWRVYGRFTQRFGASQDSESNTLGFQSASITLQADYSQDYFLREHEIFKDDFFRYGYIGQFTTYQGRDYLPGTDSLTGIFGSIHQTFRDTLIAFTPGQDNPVLARYTQRYYELNGWEGFDSEGNPVYDRSKMEALANYNNIQGGGGLINGDNLDSRGRSIYGMWVYNGDLTNARRGMTDDYTEQIQNQYRITGQGMIDLGSHNLVAGFEFEQRTQRSYSINPRALWTVARLRANTHIEQLDYENLLIEYPGPVISYHRLNSAPGPYTAEDEQAFIDFNLRRATGLDPDGVDFLDVNNIDPNVYKLEYFSADELYNGGNALVSYHGYSAYGNRTRGRVEFDDFFSERDAYGNPTRPIAPFNPIYVAGYIEDEFQLDDVHFNVGLRVDRYDANQQVLKDPYVLFPTVKAGDDEATALLAEGRTAHPSNIGEDYVVYVDNVQNPTEITGYRNGDVWYNAEGAELEDASSLRVANGLPAPLLVNKEQTNSVDITSESFEDYDPTVNFMPRIAFSFPISMDAKFYAHYDVLTMRPSFGNRLDPSDYYFLQSRASSAELDNPNLKPERTVDYQVGFKQKVTYFSTLDIAAFYRESRNMIQVMRVFDAYPIEYRTYGNIDFATVKGMTVTYDMRAIKNLSMRVSYTLQFAEGTGSSATSQLNLARSGEPNLRAPIRLSYDQRHQIVANIDYHIDPKTYAGPVVGNWNVLENAGANLVIRGGSGEPYNPQANFTSAGLFTEAPSPIQQGQINSASLPWKFRFDLGLDKRFEHMTIGSSKRLYNLVVYAQIVNLLNTRNINNVYRATGNPQDDGYLNSPVGREFIEDQTSQASFTEYYAMKLMDPAQWELPRRFRVGVRMEF